MWKDTNSSSYDFWYSYDLFTGKQYGWPKSAVAWVLPFLTVWSGSGSGRSAFSSPAPLGDSGKRKRHREIHMRCCGKSRARLSVRGGGAWRVHTDKGGEVWARCPALLVLHGRGWGTNRGWPWRSHVFAPSLHLSHPIMANAGSSWRSKGNSIRKLVRKRAVMVTERRHFITAHCTNTSRAFYSSNHLTAECDMHELQSTTHPLISYLLTANKQFSTVGFSLEVRGLPNLTGIFIPHGQHSEYEGTEGGSKISPPVISHSERGRCNLNTEQHTWRRDRHEWGTRTGCWGMELILRLRVKLQKKRKGAVDVQRNDGRNFTEQRGSFGGLTVEKVFGLYGFVQNYFLLPI